MIAQLFTQMKSFEIGRVFDIDSSRELVLLKTWKLNHLL
jgi:hypothetical protein